MLGWAKPVYDQTANVAAAVLYEDLAKGRSVDESVARARQKLLDMDAPDWHLLRLHAEDRALRQHATDLADGNPRLLEWLNKILADPETDPNAILAAMEKVGNTFRESVFLQTLLAGQSQESRTVLAYLALFTIPVDEETLKATSQMGDLTEHLRRCEILGLLEAATRPHDGTGEYYVSRIVTPYLEEILEQSVAAQACGRGASHLYERLANEDEGNTFEHNLEIHRLAMIAQEKQIAGEMAVFISKVLIHANRYGEVVALCRETLPLTDHYRVLHEMARAEEVIGLTKQARQHYERAMEACPGPEETEDRQVQFEYGHIIYNLAGLLKQVGEIDRALALYEESAQISELLDNVQGKAAILANMAWAAGQQGDTAREKTLCLEAARALVQVGAWLDCITVLGNLGTSEGDDAGGFAAQALWLCMRTQPPLDAAVRKCAQLFGKVEAGSDTAPLLAIYAIFLVKRQGEKHPKSKELLELAAGMLGACAAARDIEGDKIQEWMIAKKLNDPEYFMPALNGALEAMVAEQQWVFDPASFGAGEDNLG